MTEIDSSLEADASTLSANSDFVYSINKRDPSKRVFVNRSLRLEKIQFFGFDMDYTLAEYKSPQMEEMSFNLIVKRLISIGYPEDFCNFKYNPIFPVRGLWFDLIYGNLLKVDGFGNILVAVHGFKFLNSSEIEELYPNKFLHLSDSRIYVLNTLFNLPETYLVACMVDYFDKHSSFQSKSDKTGVKSGEVVMSYKSIFQDIRRAVDWVHVDSDLKEIILSNLDHYVVKDERIVKLLVQIKNSGRKTFLLTNSDYQYTHNLMKYLLGDDWTSYFDITVVNASKPLWFAEGTVFREVNTQSGALKIGIHTGPLKKGAVYSGGSCDSFRRLVKARGKDVLYIGDHIFGDVLRSKKARGWRTFLVVPELQHELQVWTGKRPLFEKLRELDSTIADIYKNLDGTAFDKPKIEGIVDSIRSITCEMNEEYGVLGSLFRSGSRTTFFASQVERYADIYASSCYNLVYYPIFYLFRAQMTLMPHESTVNHSDRMRGGFNDNVGQQVRDWAKSSKPGTFCFEEEDGDDEDAVSLNSDERQRSTNVKSGSTSDRSTVTATEEGNTATDNHNLNNTDVIVAKSAFVEEDL